MKKSRFISLVLSIALVLSLSAFSAGAVESEIVSSMSVQAKAALLVDMDTDYIMFEQNAYERAYPASITKILTALIAMEQCPLDEMVTYSNEAVNSINWQTDSNIGIQAGEQITVEQSLYGLLVGSANEVANALAEHVSGSVQDFAKLMNERAEALGCVDSHFANANGIFDENHYTSAYDMAQIARAFFSNDLLCKISGTATYTIPRSATVSKELFVSSKNQLLPGKEYAYEYLVGSKTGYTSEARQTLVSCAQKDGMKLICVVMKEESPSQFTDTIELFNYGFSSFHVVNVADADSRYTVGNELFFESDADAALLRSLPSILPIPLSCRTRRTMRIRSPHSPMMTWRTRLRQRRSPLPTTAYMWAAQRSGW